MSPKPGDIVTILPIDSDWDLTYQDGQIWTKHLNNIVTVERLQGSDYDIVVKLSGKEFGVSSRYVKLLYEI